MRARVRFQAATVACALALAPPRAPGQARPATASGDRAIYAPDLVALLRPPASELRDVIERWVEDRDGLLRRYRVEYSPARRATLRQFYASWLSRLDAIDFDKLSLDGRVDYLLLRNRLEHEQRLLAREEKVLAETRSLLPFADSVMALEEARRRMDTIDPSSIGRRLARLAGAIDSTRAAVDSATHPSRIVAYRAATILVGLRKTLEEWFKFYDGYDPLFSWWATAPYQRADSALKGYVAFLREKLVGIKPGQDEPIVGLPLGREAVLEDLNHELIPYTPEELIATAQRDFAWSEGEMKKAAREMGLRDDWKAALEKVKQDHVEPGRQPDLVRDLGREAIAFVTQHDLVTVPPLAADIWRMEMLSPERQKESPFFLGGEVVMVSYPTESMTEDDKLMSMRGNNVHFARATLFHELIPGHHLQGFMTVRYNPQRRAFRTPFWSEGNAFYWETIFWDLGFPKSPEDRIGMLFWRMHRAARIMFSLGFHLGTMTPEQAIDFLVNRVGHERANATAEVRRSFNGDYSPLYQVAYMIGGLQFRALHHDLVDSRRMTNRQFHDAILQNGPIPVELVRALLQRQPLRRDWRPSWRFTEAPAAP